MQESYILVLTAGFGPEPGPARSAHLRRDGQPQAALQLQGVHLPQRAAGGSQRPSRRFSLGGQPSPSRGQAHAVMASLRLQTGRSRRTTAAQAPRPAHSAQRTI